MTENLKSKGPIVADNVGTSDKKIALPSTTKDANVNVKNVSGDAKTGVPKTGYTGAKVAAPDMHSNGGAKVENSKTGGHIGFHDAKAATPGEHNNTGVKAQNVPDNSKTGAHIAVPEPNVVTPDIHNVRVKAQNVAGNVNAGIEKPGYTDAKAATTPDSLKYTVGVKPLVRPGNPKTGDSSVVPTLKMDAYGTGSGKSKLPANKMELL